MPELPEVETVRRTLMPLVVGRTIRGVLFLWEGLVANVSLPELRAHLVDGSITDISRRGKYLVVHIGGRGYLVVHLRMTGRLLVAPLAAPYERHLRGLIDLGHDESLRFADQRKFGRFYWADDETGLAAIIRVGIEPLAPDFTPEALASMTANGKAAIKAGDPLTGDEIQSLLAQREQVERSSNCPHGRPTTLRLSIADLERQFKRA